MGDGSERASGVAAVLRRAVVALPVAIVASFGLFFLPPAPAMASGKSCVTGKCHSGMGKEGFVHAPVAAGECDACHVGEGKHTFVPIARVGDLCYGCHGRMDTKKHVHKPVSDGDCTMCHNPHQSSSRKYLRAEGRELCFFCHEREGFSGAFVHGPVAVGDCSVCHDPHQADYRRLLSGPVNDVCFRCHSDKGDAFKGKRSLHGPVGDSCTNCHSPHAGDYRYNFTERGNEELCFRCHEEKREWISKARVRHGGLDTEKKCLACHDPHAADYPKQLIREASLLCIMCHDRSLATRDGRIGNMAKVLSSNRDAHGPVKRGDCSACHNVHGSDHFRILRKNYAAFFYAPFQEKVYELCFECHDKTLVTERKTTTMTGFRNGEKNMHYKHVRKLRKGRTCRACHEVHASNNPKYIRDEVAFGAWDLPVGFEISDNGGSCLPGCHARFGYDRNSPVKNK